MKKIFMLIIACSLISSSYCAEKETDRKTKKKVETNGILNIFASIATGYLAYVVYKNPSGGANSFLDSHITRAVFYIHDLYRKNTEPNNGGIVNRIDQALRKPEELQFIANTSACILGTISAYNGLVGIKKYLKS